MSGEHQQANGQRSGECSGRGHCPECVDQPTEIGQSAAPVSEFEKVLRQAISDPGVHTPRGDNYEEPLVHWEARAVVLAIQSRLSVEQRIVGVGGVVNGAGNDSWNGGHYLIVKDDPPARKRRYEEMCRG